MRMYEVTLRAVWSVKLQAGSGPEALQEAHKEVKRLIEHYEKFLRETSPEDLYSVYCDVERRGDVARL